MFDKLRWLFACLRAHSNKVQRLPVISPPGCLATNELSTKGSHLATKRSFLATSNLMRQWIKERVIISKSRPRQSIFRPHPTASRLLLLSSGQPSATPGTWFLAWLSHFSTWGEGTFCVSYCRVQRTTEVNTWKKSEADQVLHKAGVYTGFCSRVHFVRAQSRVWTVADR